MQRITDIEIGETQVGILGDPHLGRSFVRGVALEKRGIRERMVMEDFRSRLERSGQYHVFVCLGDLFDKWAVPYSVVWEAAWVYLQAARKNPKTTYYVIGGNHDISRDLEKKGALDLFELIVTGGSLRGNIKVIRHTRGAVFDEVGGARVGFFPFHPTKRADELVNETLDVAIGHYDTVFGKDNMIPTEKLAEKGCKVAYTGHVHLPDEFDRDGVHVVQVGSMQPYAHGEDRGEMYVTLRPDEVEGKDLSQKCVRIQLEPGEVFDQEIDCLQLSFKRTASEDEETDEVSMGDFDLMKLFHQAFEEADVPQAVRDRITERFEEARVKE